eukprot:Gregarina_sp_Poly_1__11239@NODE_927_length_5682_cov_62_921460_g650_i1_p1_GENE_NODE_927_length_5682_cov_62_921460_g650_i1NODE_927_length_5682_cov_62_921460_g650_i1_p1_ORF_typecomplete_len736_score110_22OSTHTH/PF12872_7/1_1e04OSTHTH/PF12872_7/0_089OSTHTH/PF12872_7/1_4e08_NODE_927_length_5682_cov_62_921460_g650_i11162209
MTKNDPSSSQSPLNSESLLVDEEADGLEQYLMDPSEVHEEEFEPPPAKRLKLNSGEGVDVLPTSASRGAKLILTAAPFDRAFSSPGFQGSSAIYFRLSLTEGSQHIIKKESSAVKYGLSLWAKALVTLLDNEDLFTVISDSHQDTIVTAEPDSTTEQQEIKTGLVDENASEPRSQHDLNLNSSYPGGDKEEILTSNNGLAEAVGESPSKSEAKSTRKDEQPSYLEETVEVQANTLAHDGGDSTESQLVESGLTGEDAASTAVDAFPQEGEILEGLEDDEGADTLVLEDRELQEMRVGLKHLEGLTFGMKKLSSSYLPSSPAGADSNFSYESGHHLTICGLEFYQCVNKIIVSVISRRGQLLGRHVLEFLQQVQKMGAEAETGGFVEFGTTSLKHLMDAIPPPPHNHSIRTAKTYATLAAIGHLRAKKAATAPLAGRPLLAPGSIGVSAVAGAIGLGQMGGGGLSSLAGDGISQSGTGIVFPPTSASGGAPCVFSVLPPVPPPRIDLVGTQPVKAWNAIDPRFHNIPDWVVSVITNLVIRYDNKLFSQLQAAWLQTYGSHVDLMMWGFPSFHDLLLCIPGVILRREGGDFRVSLQRQGGWLEQSRGWGQRSVSGMDLSVFVSNSSTASKVPPEISTRLLLLLNEHNGCNIGHLQQLWRKECGEPLDFSSLGFAKFSDLLAEVPGITLRKEESTVTAHL